MEMGEAAGIVSVLIADSQRLFSQALSMAMREFRDLEVLTERPASGLLAVDKILELKPDVSLLDYWMTDMEGPAAVERVLASAPDQKVILLSWFYSPEHIRRALDAGAAGFIPKDADVETVVDAIRAAASGQDLVLSGQLGDLSETLDAKYRENLEISKRMQTLTRRELEVLRALSTGLPIEEIADQLFLATQTVKTHIGNILRKTGARSHAEALAMARQCGLLR